MSTRRERLLLVMEQTKNSLREVEASSKEWTLAHDAFNRAMTEAPRKGRRSGTDMENLRRHAFGAYEMLLDCLRIHSENVAHLEALRGKL